ncbi:MAG TPA: TonB-dependent receptor [Dysgonomonas sp.]|uniref:TonB-dependent receptor n=1 Tax=unclassified Dysgonomonas TaxID=2630389 RepID=UPI0025C09311|nr:MULTISPECIES: TonB-dependent receptor plug domain-containing protein [unclassified Dysgonomonas]HML65204.1 TonB-dependent receptor [Dysgonomonas sp.]
MKHQFARPTILFSLLFLFSGISFAQTGKILGTLTFEDNNPVAHAFVYIKALEKQVVSDERGRYEMTDIPYGEYLLEVKTIGAEKLESSITVNKAVSNYSFVLVEQKNILGEVTVSAMTLKNKIETKGFAVNAIEIKDVALQSIQTNELLDRAAGVRIRQDGGLGSHIHYNINGMTGNAVKIFIDGVPATNYGQSFSLNSIPPAMIERIEVYKGVVPGYLSDDALGGAINIVLKQNRKSQLTTSYSYGSFNTHQYNINGSYQSKNGFTVDASGFFNYSDNDYEVWGEEITFRDYQGTVTSNQRAKRFHDAYRSYGAKVDIGWDNVKWADRFRIGGVFSDDRKEMQNGVTLQRVFGDRHSKRNAKIATLTYSKEDFFLQGLSLKMDASYSHLKTQVIDSVGIMYDWRGPILYPDGTPVMYTSGAELGNQKTAEKNTDKTFVIRANIGYRINHSNTVYVNNLFNNFDRGVSDKFLPLGLQRLQNTRDLQKNITTITYENISFSDKLRTNIFYKYYYQKVTLKEPYLVTSNPATYDVTKSIKKEDYNSYGAALSYALTPKLYLMGSIERAIRFPTEREIFGNAAINLNPSDVSAEKSLNANIGINLGAYTFNNHSVRLNTSLFYRDTKGMIREAISPGNSGTSYYENLEDVLTRGIDAEITYNYNDKLNLNFNISKFDVLFNTKYNKEGAEYLYYRKQIRNEPSFKYNINVAYYHNNLFIKNSRASLNYNISYVNKFLRNWSNIGLTNLDYIPTQFSNNIGAMFTFPSRKVAISFDVKNIFNKQIYDNFGLQKPGRAFFGKITYNIL